MASGSGGSSGGGTQGQNDPNCPTPWPEPGTACSEGQRCFHPGSTNPCAPPDTTYTCSAGTWTVYVSSHGTCDNNPEACPGCPSFAPAQGSSCSPYYCPGLANCQFGAITAKCVAGLWQVTDSSDPSTGGTGNEAGGAGAGGAP